jgi:hypothetical protein
MRSAEEHAARVQMIIQFHKFFKEKYVEVEKAILENRREQPIGFHGGVWDEEDERKARGREDELTGVLHGLQAKRAFIEECWKLVVLIFGRPDVDLAIVEETQRIGDLPMLEVE